MTKPYPMVLRLRAVRFVEEGQSRIMQFFALRAEDQLWIGITMQPAIAHDLIFKLARDPARIA